MIVFGIAGIGIAFVVAQIGGTVLEVISEVEVVISEVEVVINEVEVVMNEVEVIINEVEVVISEVGVKSTRKFAIYTSPLYNTIQFKQSGCIKTWQVHSTT